MLVMNFIAFILCAIAAIIHADLGNIGWVIIETTLALLNLPFAIKWLMTIF